MGRVDDAELARLKSEVSLVRLVEAKGIALVKHGAGGDLVACCPFHEDRSPSFVVSPSKNLWRCHGACQTGGSVVDFVMRIEAVTFRHAVDLLRQGVISARWRVRRRRCRRLRSCRRMHRRRLRTVSCWPGWSGSMARRLGESPEALGYLARRRIDMPEAVTTFRLGYANRTLGYRLPASNRREGADLRGRLQALGIIRGSGHEHFNGSLVIPVINALAVTEMYGRKLLDNLRPGTPVRRRSSWSSVIRVKRLSAERAVERKPSISSWDNL